MPQNQAEMPLELIEVLRGVFFANDQTIRIKSGKKLILADGTEVESGGLAPTGASYVTTASNSTLTAEKVLTAGTGIDITVGGSTVTISNTAAVIPSGLIAIWSGSTGSIPSGWSLCDGTGGTPDLRNRFVIGAGSTYSVNDTGGSTTVTTSNHSHSNGSLATDSDSHSHGAGSYAVGSHLHSMPTGNVTGSSPNWSDITYQTGSTNLNVTHQHTHTVVLGSANSGSTTPSFSGSSGSDSHSHDVTGSTASDGSEVLNILNPYMALAYIMKD